MLRTSTRVFEEIGGVCARIRHIVRSVIHRRLDRRETLRLVDVWLRDVAVTVATGSMVIGGIVGLQGLGYVSRYSASEVFGWAAALSAFRDVGPTLLAFALAARLGTRNAAETAVLAARERLDAMCALGLDPTHFVAAPRVVAMVVVCLALYPPCALGIMSVACVFAAVLGGQSLAVSAWSVVEYVEPTVLCEGLLRMSLFGVTIGLATTHAGLSLWLTERRSAADVGAAVYGGSVISVCGIVVVNLVASLLGTG